MNPLFPDPNFRRTFIDAGDLARESFSPGVISSSTRLYSLQFSDLNLSKLESAFDALGYHLGDVAVAGIFEPLKRNLIPDGDKLHYQYNDSIPITLSYQRLICTGEDLYTQSRAECSVRENRRLTGLPAVRVTRAARSDKMGMIVEFSDIPLPESIVHADKLLDVWGLRGLREIFRKPPPFRYDYTDKFGPAFKFNLDSEVTLTTKLAPWLGDYDTEPSLSRFLTPISIHLVGASHQDRNNILLLSNDTVADCAQKSRFLDLFDYFIFEQGGVEDELLYKYGKKLSSVVQLRMERSISLGGEGSTLDFSGILDFLPEGFLSESGPINLSAHSIPFRMNNPSLSAERPLILHRPDNLTTSSVTIEHLSTRIGSCQVRLSSDAFDSHPRAQLGEFVEHQRPTIGVIFPHESLRLKDDTNAARWAMTKRLARKADCPFRLDTALNTFREFVHRQHNIAGIEFGAKNFIIRANI